MQNFLLVFFILVILSGCNSHSKIKINRTINKNNLVSIRAHFTEKNYFVLSFSNEIKISNYGDSPMVLLGFVVKRADLEPLIPQIYTIDTMNINILRNNNYVLNENDQISLNMQINLPIDSIQTKAILDCYNIPKDSIMIYKEIPITTYKDLILKLTNIKTDQDHNLYNQIFKNMIFKYDYKEDYTKNRTIYYDWLNNRTYDKFPNSEMVNIVK